MDNGPLTIDNGQRTTTNQPLDHSLLINAYAITPTQRPINALSSTLSNTRGTKSVTNPKMNVMNCAVPPTTMDADTMSNFASRGFVFELVGIALITVCGSGS